VGPKIGYAQLSTGGQETGLVNASVVSLIAASNTLVTTF
jgi:hypothetical protein